MIIMLADWVLVTATSQCIVMKSLSVLCSMKYVFYDFHKWKGFQRIKYFFSCGVTPSVSTMS